MKLAVASDDGVNISSHFGRAKGFSVFEIVDNVVVSEERRANNGRHNGTCGSCDHDVMIESLKDCDALISHGMGKRIYFDLASHKIRPIVSEETLVSDAVNSYISDKIKNRTDRLH